MFGNYTLYAYDDKWNCTQEWSFENVKITCHDNTISVTNTVGKLLYLISTTRCNVVVMESDDE